MKLPTPEAPEAAPELESPRLSIEVQVMFFDTDCAGVVHNIAYLRFIEIARTLLAEQLGMGLVAMARSQIFPVVVRTEIDYRRPPNSATNSSSTARWKASSACASGAPSRFAAPPMARSSSTSRQMLAVIQMPAGKPVRLPADWAIRYGHLKSPSRTLKSG